MRMPWSELQSSSWAEGQFEKPMKALKIPVDQSSAGKTKHNSLAERNNQFLLLATTTCLLEAGIPPCFWKYASHRHDSFSLVFSWMKKLAVGLCLGSGCRSEFSVSACALQAHEFASQTTRRRVARCMWVCPRIGAPISSQAQRSCDCQRLCLSCMPSLRCKVASGSWHQEAIHESPRAKALAASLLSLRLYRFSIFRCLWRPQCQSEPASVVGWVDGGWQCAGPSPMLSPVSVCPSQPCCMSCPWHSSLRQPFTIAPTISPTEPGAQYLLTAA